MVYKRRPTTTAATAKLRQNDRRRHLDRPTVRSHRTIGLLRLPNTIATINQGEEDSDQSDWDNPRQTLERSQIPMWGGTPQQTTLDRHQARPSQILKPQEEEPRTSGRTDLGSAYHSGQKKGDVEKPHAYDESTWAPRIGEALNQLKKTLGYQDT